MRLTSIELHPAGSSDICVLSFRDPKTLNPYNVKEITGLDADEIVPRFYGGSGSSKFYNLSLERRSIVMKIVLNPRPSLGETFSSLRDMLYKFISSSRTGVIELQFKNGPIIVATVSGFVKKFETAHFEKNQQVQITLECDDPMLRAVTPITLDSLALDSALTTITDVLSTAPHGFKFQMSVLADQASFIFDDPNDDSWSFVVTPVGGFLVGDTIHFSSEHNDKYFYIVRGASTIHLADAIIPGSVWPIIFPGDNAFAVTNPASFDWTHASYYPTYWGV